MKRYSAGLADIDYSEHSEGSGGSYPEMEEGPDGDYVEYDAHIAETKRLTRIVQLMVQKMTDITGSCPLDLYDVDWDDCEEVCSTGGSSPDEVTNKCWVRYFTEQEVRNEPGRTKNR